MHGWGLFAGQPIPQDTFVIEYVGEVVDNVIAGGWAVQERKVGQLFPTFPFCAGSLLAGERRVGGERCPLDGARLPPQALIIKCSKCLLDPLYLLCRYTANVPLPADKREKKYERDNTGTMYLFRMDASQVIDATHRVGAHAGQRWC